MQPSIILLIPYFGQWPPWFEFFLHTCRFNPSIQWLFFTDCQKPINSPSNVNFNIISFSAYKQKVSKKLGIDFNPDSPYKLCDLKPALGFIHEQELKGFDFWGFSDIDLVYGDLRKYFTSERLAKYELLSTHERRVSGHFCLLLNSEKMRDAFKLMKNWKVRLSENTHHALDEGAFSRIFIKHKNFPEPMFNFFSMFNSWRRKSEFVEAFSTPNAGVAWIDGSDNFPTEWNWNNGVLTNNIDKNKEFPYFHFFGWKMDAWNKNTCFPSFDINCDSFSISKSGFDCI